jgi:hypothetical protein
MRNRDQRAHGVSILSLTWALTTAILVLVGCEPSRTTGRLGLVTRRNVDSAMLLKSGQSYRELGPSSASVCYETRESQAPPDNFAKVADQAMNLRFADALIDVTTVTHRGSYFTVWAPIPVMPIGVAPVEVSERGSTCTSVSGTAIQFVESPYCAPCVMARKPPRTWLQPEDPSGDSGEVVAVTSLHPTLKWEPFPGPGEDVTYDLTIWSAKAGWSRVHQGPIAYERQKLIEPSHRIETALEPATHYLWAVRAHFKHDGQTQVTPWSFEISQPTSKEPHYYHFWTPASLSPPQ